MTARVAVRASDASIIASVPKRLHVRPPQSWLTRLQQGESNPRRRPLRFVFKSPTELEQVWLDLERRAAPPFFLSWDWIGCWVREASLHPAILIGRAEGRVVLLGILTPSTRRILLPITVDGLQLHMTGNPQQDVITIEYNGFLVEHDLVGKIEADAIAFLLGGITVDGHRREELHLKNIPAALERSVAREWFPFPGGSTQALMAHRPCRHSGGRQAVTSIASAPTLASRSDVRCGFTRSAANWTLHGHAMCLRR